jgi:uncharacterized membrane protein
MPIANHDDITYKKLNSAQDINTPPWTRGNPNAIASTPMFFNDDQTTQPNDLIQRIHQRTGVALTAAVVGRCDSYPEIPWKAFAAITVVNALVQLVQILIPPAHIHPWGVPRTLGFVIGTSAAVALLTLFWPVFGRIFLNPNRAEAKTEQYAQALFLKREMFQLPGRNAFLLLIGRFETQAFFLPDRGISDRITAMGLNPVVARMDPLLRRQSFFQALLQGLSALEAALLEAGLGPAPEGSPPPGIGLIQLKGNDL